jgi:hypothetical protein
VAQALCKAGDSLGREAFGRISFCLSICLPVPDTERRPHSGVSCLILTMNLKGSGKSARVDTRDLRLPRLLFTGLAYKLANGRYYFAESIYHDSVDMLQC